MILYKRLILTLVLYYSQYVVASETEQVVVVGAGIVGASIAYHAAVEGMQVTVLEKQAPASRASKGTFAWLNASWAKQPFSYHQLNQKSVSYWHELSAELNIPIKWGGSLEWFATHERSKKLIEQIVEQRKWGERASIMNTQVARKLEPNVLFPNDTAVAYSANDGALNPEQATQIMLKAAKQEGVNINFPCEVTGVSTPAKLVNITSSCGNYSASKVVLAVGINSQLIKSVTGLDIPQRSTPGIIAITKPMPKVIDKIIVAPGVHIHQRQDGRVVIGEQGGAPASHSQRLANYPTRFPSREYEEQHFERMIKAASSVVPKLANAQLQDMIIGWRPLPLDGHPVLGFSDDSQSIYIAVMHSGVTLAPIVGKYVTQELRGNVQISLNDYRPHREFKRVRRY